MVILVIFAILAFALGLSITIFKNLNQNAFARIIAVLLICCVLALAFVLVEDAILFVVF